MPGPLCGTSACALVALLVAGCETFSVAVGPTIEWSAPAGLGSEDLSWGADVEAHGYPFCHAFGLGTAFPEEGEAIMTAYYAFDFGVLSWLGRSLGDYPRIAMQPRHVLAPFIGLWRWNGSPEERGLLTGIKVGAAYGFLSIEYNFSSLHDLAAKETATIQALRVGYGF